jgi:T3SS negative regulator,GrlR
VIKNGIYSLTALAIDGAGVDAGGVLILHDGKIYGGDSYVFYVGTYKCSGGKWEGEMLSKEHTPTNRPIVERVQQIVFSGSYTDTGAEVEATAVVGKQRISYNATLRLLVAA